MNLGVVIPVGPGRLENLEMVCASLRLQSRVPVVVVADGVSVEEHTRILEFCGDWKVVGGFKHEPGREQPRNTGVRFLPEDVTHVWFLDSDVIVEPNCLDRLEESYAAGPEDRILVGPYEWLPGWRPEPGYLPPEYHALHNDPRSAAFGQHGPDQVLYGDLSAGLGCFSGNLVWPVEEFRRVGGFWNELHHGRCEDGELGLRAVAMGVGISFARDVRGWHLQHAINNASHLQRNARDVPMINDRHPWLQGSAVFMVERDGKAFDARCACGEVVPTIQWWAHAETCDQAAGLPIAR